MERSSHVTDMDQENELRTVLDATTLGMLTDAVVFGASGCEPLTYQVIIHRNPTADQIIALAGKSLFPSPDSYWLSVDVLRCLRRDKTAVPTIAVILQESAARNVRYINSLTDAMLKYSRDVHPSLFLILCYARCPDALPLLNKITTSGIKALVHRTYTASGLIDLLVKLMTSPVTSLKSVEDQMGDVMRVLRHDGVKAVFERMVGQVPIVGLAPGPDNVKCHSDILTASVAPPNSAVLN